MTTRRGSRRKGSAGEEEDTRAELEKARADAETALTRAKDEEQARLQAEEALAEVQEALASVQTEAEQERQARAEFEEELTEARRALASTQAEVEEERRARIEAEKALTDAHEDMASQAEVEEEHKARIEAEKALAEAREDLASAGMEVEQEREVRVETKKALAKAQEALAAAQMQLEQERQIRTEAEAALAEARKAAAAKEENKEPPATVRVEGAEQRVSFVVRLTVDERGQPRRTEIEHAQSGAKQVFPALDAQQLATFMEGCISPPTAPAAVEGKAPMPELPGRAVSLTISNVRVLGTVAPEESFVIQVRYRLQGPEALSVSAQESPFQVEVLANEVMTGASKLLATYEAKLVENQLEYAADMQAPGLSPGLYRLLTVVTLLAPVNILNHYEGPIVNLTSVESSVNPSTA